MNHFRYAVGLLAVISGLLTCAPASAFFHLWRFTEFFSNADGSVQFIEMRNTNNNEHFASGAQIRSMSTGKVFTFPSNLSSPSTANKSLLIATSGFGALPGGVAPDFTLPSTNFFNPAGDTITLFADFAIDTRTFTSLPADGVMSRIYPSNTLATNTPTNFFGASGSVNLSAPSPTGDYNRNGVVDAADYVIWRATLNGTVAMPGDGADGDRSGTIDAGDYDFWRARFGNIVTTSTGSGRRSAAVPEPSTLASLLVALLVLTLIAPPAFQPFAHQQRHNH